jgi:simple sugar transport system ATP-binding protein
VDELLGLVGLTGPVARTRYRRLSGGERQTLAIARAEYFGARVLILDEPTSALGVKQAAIVLRHIVRARARGLAVIFITHNVQHALPVGDRFTILSHGRSAGVFRRGEVSLDQLLALMGGGQELSDLSRELEQLQAEGLRGAPDRAAQADGGSPPAG